MIIKSGGINTLVYIMTTTKVSTIIKHGSWALSNLCRGKPPPKYELVKCAIPIFVQIMKT